MALTGPIAPGDIERLRTPIASSASASTGRPAISPQTDSSTPAGRYDSLSPPLLRLLHFVVEKVRPAGVELSVCGEMAGRPVEALALLAIGVRTLSMSPGAIGPVKAMIRSLDLNEVTGFMNAALTQPDRPMRETLRLFAADHAIEI